MSIIGEILVLLDIYKELNLDEICSYITSRKKQTLSSALGRLSSRGLLEKVKKNNKQYFKITKAGSNYLTQNLSPLKDIQAKKVSPKWQIVVFNIPEKIRKARDDFRKELAKLGFGRLQDSSWISPKDSIEKIKDIIVKLDIVNNVTIIYTENLTEKRQIELVEKLNWDWGFINSSYKKFITDTEKFFKTKNKSVFTARKLVYNYAQILQYDPKLDAKIAPKNNLTNQAYTLYQKIRPYCYSK